MLLLLFLPGLLLTWGLVSLIGSGSDGSDGAGTDVETRLTDGPDAFAGNAANDRVFAGGGDDIIEGNLGTDTLFLGDGNDFGSGGAGVDTIYGGAGDDFMDGGTNNDFLYGGDGNDTTYIPDDPATTGDDSVSSDERGDDFIRGGAGNDSLLDGFGANTIYGDSGDDYIDSVELDYALGAARDFVYGGTGDDIMWGDRGDELTGGEGADQFGVFSTLINNPVVVKDFTDGVDTMVINYVASTDATFSLTEVGGDTIASLNGISVLRVEGVTGLDASDFSLVRTDP